MKQAGTYKKSFAPKASAEPANQSVKKEKQLPEKSLSLKLNGSDEFQSITGLFQNKSKAGNTYFYGSPKDSEEGFYVFEQVDKKTGEFKGYTLNYKENAKSKTEKFKKLADLKENDKGTLYGPNLENKDEIFFVTNRKQK